MAYSEPFSPFVPVVTNGDLSTKQNLAVVLNGSGTLDVAGAGVFILGILIDDPASGKTGSVQTYGTAKVKAGAAVTVGDYVKTDGSGQAITASSTNKSFGVALATASGANSLIPVRLHTPGLLAP